ncbi:hypothetical protein [Sunxiuqinia sp. sy24]|uniref:hypothetical protein n=1 Tax=Sunxiuqinia sp. sy24 TaxID=3461495 RepID=UPI0040465172
MRQVKTIMLAFENRADHIKRTNVLGSWLLSNEQLDKSKDEGQDSAGQLVTRFKLNSDSTATVFASYLGERSTIAGSWRWKADKKMGSKTFGLSLQSDVLIEVQGKVILGLRLKEIDGEISLMVGDAAYMTASQ